MRISKTTLIGYKVEYHNDLEWSKHYKILYSCDEISNLDACSVLGKLLNFNDSHSELEGFSKEFLLDALLHANERLHPREDNPYDINKLKDIIPHLEDYKEFMIKEDYIDV